MFGISIAFARERSVHAAGVSLPIPGDLFLAARGAGATHNGAAIHVTGLTDVSRARMELDLSHLGQRHHTLERAAGLIGSVGQLRCHSSAVVGLCSVAAGEMEGFFHVGLAPWDYAAGWLIVEEAGGRVTRLDGAPLTLFESRQGVLASNGLLHPKFVSLIAA